MAKVRRRIDLDFGIKDKARVISDGLIEVRTLLEKFKAPEKNQDEQVVKSKEIKHYVPRVVIHHSDPLDDAEDSRNESD